MNVLRNSLAEGLGALAFSFLFIISSYAAVAYGVAYLSPLFFGLCFMIAYYCYTPYGRGHFDPALGFSLLLTRKAGIVEFLCNALGQLIGTFAGAALAYGAYYLIEADGEIPFPTNYLSDEVSGLGLLVIFAIFMVLSGIMSFFYLQLKSKKEYNSVAGIVLALGFTVISYAAMPFVGGMAYSFFPYLTLATNAASSWLGQSPAWDETWIFFLAPFLGACFGAGIYVLLNHRMNPLRKIRVKED